MIHKAAFIHVTELSLVGLAFCACTSTSDTRARGEQAAANSADAAVERHEGHPPVNADHEGGSPHDSGHVAGGDHGRGHEPPTAHGVDDPLVERRIGEVIGDFAVRDSTGEPFQLSSLRRTGKSKGEIAVLTFWCTTCSSCRRIEKDFDEKAKEYEAQDAVFLMVDSNYTDSPQRVNQFRDDKELGFRVLMDPESEIARYFGAKLTTTTAVLDAEGRLRYYGAFAGAENAVRSLMAGEDVAVPLNPGSG